MYSCARMLHAGVNAALRAYTAILQLMGGEAPYTGALAKYNADQRFFLGYANTWCVVLSNVCTDCM